MRHEFVTAILCRNERTRYLPEVLDHHGQWGPVVVLDDCSDDGTYEFCRDHPAVVHVERTPTSPAWGAEAPARTFLWDMASGLADWILVADADMLLSADPRPLCRAVDVNAWAFPLFDIWDADRRTFRADGFWRAHLHPRPWLFAPGRTRLPDVPAYKPSWPTRGIHTGHSPANFPARIAVAPPRYYWLHLAYARPEDRQAKLLKYRSQYHQMTEFEKAHAESIADPNPGLRILPFAKKARVLVGGPVRKRADVLKAHLDSLAWQELPDRVEFTYCFVDDYPGPDEGSTVLSDFVGEHGGRVLKWANTRSDDFSDSHPVTHQWTQSAMGRMAEIKNALLRECVTGQFDYLWLVDSDLILDRSTFQSLFGAQKPVVAGVYWTRWNTDPRIHAGPQVWQVPPYGLGLPHYPEHEFRADLVNRELLKVGGLGACTLIRRDVIEKGVHFGKPPGFPSGGLMDGEDRHFCEWAKRLHVELWADAWPDIFHVYHARDVERMSGMLARLSAPHPPEPATGACVSVRLTNVEDGIGPVQLRCRLGDGTLLPEVENHLMRMKRGELKMIRLHYPATMPPVTTTAGLKALAGQVRLIQCELLDCKPWGLPPVVEDEFHVADTGVAQDATLLTPEQRQTFGAEA